MSEKNPFRVDISETVRCAHVMEICNGAIIENNKTDNIRGT